MLELLVNDHEGSLMHHNFYVLYIDSLSLVNSCIHVYDHSTVYARV